jgi:hypothetical protein
MTPMTAIIRRRPAVALPLLLLVLLGCGGGRGPDRTVRRFFRAMNDKDVSQLLSCIDPRQERMMRAAFRLVEKATGFPIDDFFELLPGLQQAFGDQLREDFRFSQLRIRSREITGTTARVLVSVKSTYRSGSLRSTRTEELEFSLEEFEDAGWRIISIRTPGAVRGP